MTDEVPGVREHGTLPSFRQHPLRGRLAGGDACAAIRAASRRRIASFHLAFMTDEEAAGQGRGHG